MEGELEPAEEAAALQHLATCSSCETVLAETRDVTQLAKDHGRVTLTDAEKDALLGQLLSAVDDEA